MFPNLPFFSELYLAGLHNLQSLRFAHNLPRNEYGLAKYQSVETKCDVHEHPEKKNQSWMRHAT